MSVNSNEKSFKASFFSLQPYENRSEALAVIGASLIAAVVVPVAIVVFEPLIIIGLITSLLVSFISSLSYITNDLMGNKDYLERHKEYYRDLHRTTTVLLLISIVPPVGWSVALIGVALYRGFATLFANERDEASLSDANQNLMIH